MYSGKEAANAAYPTQWALNPTAYQNVDSSQVDWAALAQQWIAMKEVAAIVAPPPAPPLKADEEGEAPMEVEADANSDGSIPPGAEWNASTNSWGGWNSQWGWGWSGSGPVDPKLPPDPAMGIPPIIDAYVPSDTSNSMPGYTSGAPTPTFQHGYWTAPQVEQNNSRSSSASRDRRSKSKNRDHKSSRTSRSQRDKAPVMAPVTEPILMPAAMSTSTIDAAKRRQLPAWIREGLEKMEREKQRAVEREQEQKAREAAEIEKKRLEEEELERLKAEAAGQLVLPPKSKFESDSEGEEENGDREDAASSSPVRKEEADEDSAPGSEEKGAHPPLVKKSKEEIMKEVMLAVRRSLTEILLEVTDQEIQTVSQEEFARYTALQASRLNAMKASKSKALAAIASGLGLGAYESSSEDSGDEDELNDLSDHQLQEIIKRKRQEFERTSREIEAEVRRAEARENEELPSTPTHATPDRPRRSRSSTTPPPVDSETPTKIHEHRISKDRRNSHKSVDKTDGIRKLDTIPEEKRKLAKRNHTPSPVSKPNKANNKESSTSSNDSADDSSSSSSDKSSAAERELKLELKAKKRQRRNSSSTSSRIKLKKNKAKKEKSHKSEDKTYSKSKHYDDYTKSDKSKSKKRDDYYDKHKSSKSRDYDKHKDKYRDDSEDERPRKRTKRSRSISYESRSGRKRSSHDRSEDRSKRRDKRSYDRDSSKRDRSYDRSGRDYDKYDRYERSRDYDRRRSRSGSHSRHRR